MDATSPSNSRDRLVRVPAGALFLQGSLRIPEIARGIVLFPYGIESDQRISYTEGLARPLGEAGFATLLVDLLTPEDKGLDALTGFFRENVDILHKRIIGIANWLREEQETQNLRTSYFGTGVTGAAALIAAAVRPDAVVTVISIDGRIDLARNYLSRIYAPVLLIVGENDAEGKNLNRDALEQLHTEKQLETIGGAANLFGDTNTQAEVAQLAVKWLARRYEHI
jgi:putative phosphoribosyl transferase